MVRLPFRRAHPIDIGNSYRIAHRMLTRLETRLRSNPPLFDEYDAFLREYLNLGHMRKVPPSLQDGPQTVYIPHHAVIRESSVTTHLRDVDYQRILWRSSPSDSVDRYQLLTVTYDTAPAPFLALRVLKQLVEDEGSNFPLAVSVLQNHLYVDDCVFGASDESRLTETRNQLITLLSKAHFQLHKWTTNAPHLLRDISPHDRGTGLEKILQFDETVKVLGVAWSPDADAFRFRVTLPHHSAGTKRAILSTIARLFDPLGWVTPTTVYAKILMQQLWLKKCSWDAPLPSTFLDRWTIYNAELPALKSLAIPRWTHQTLDIASCELHGFADASTVAYAAVVYLRVVTSSGHIVVSLLAAKSKVAPVKPLTVPRLELSAALLLARLIVFVRQALHDLPNEIPCYCWTDSTITLCWLRQPASRWKTFVANRVAQIASSLPDAMWRHVPSEENPADCASRGLLPSQLLHHDLWWKGPQWMQLSTDQWPPNIPVASPDARAEERPTLSFNLVLPSTPWELRDRFSSWPKLLRVTAYNVTFFLRRFSLFVNIVRSTKRAPCSPLIHI
ncbi:uncharacterized protein LOC143363747 [Halictus rubicundus]|uniref:uncharacterized protein LOC143363747 n=2 Tax=Halictus rubicundus TaxID=77578 RepID=UPI0040369F84